MSVSLCCTSSKWEFSTNDTLRRILLNWQNCDFWPIDVLRFLAQIKERKPHNHECRSMVVHQIGSRVTRTWFPVLFLARKQRLPYLLIIPISMAINHLVPPLYYILLLYTLENFIRRLCDTRTRSLDTWKVSKDISPAPDGFEIPHERDFLQAYTSSKKNFFHILPLAVRKKDSLLPRGGARYVPLLFPTHTCVKITISQHLLLIIQLPFILVNSGISTSSVRRLILCL